MNKIIIGVLSVIVPSLVALLFFNVNTYSEAAWVYYLPSLNAILNGTTAVVLVLAVYFIKKGNEKMHQNLMQLAFVLGALFLMSYIVYHASVPSTKFGDSNGDGILQPEELLKIGISRTVYLVVLLSHIVAALIALPLILTAFVYALTDKREKHKRIVRFTFPVWLYVSITGVGVYLLISPYY